VKNVQQTVDQYLMVLRLGQTVVHGIGYQCVDIGLDFHMLPSSIVYTENIIADTPEKCKKKS
jgi:hypothetical protein